MNTTKSKIVFITDAARSGAPLVMLEFLRWFKANSTIPFIVLLRKPGVMESEFKQLAPLFHWKYDTKPRRTLKSKLIYYSKKLIQIHNYSFYRFVAQLKENNIKLIYSNTVHNDSILEKLAPAMQVPIIIHCHELHYVMKVANIGGAMNREFALANNFITVSLSAKQNLITNYNIENDKITVVYNGLFPSFSQPTNTNELKKSDLGLSPEHFVVLAMGTPHWLKGNDLFIQIAIRVLKYEPHIRFLWVGGNINSIEYKQMLNDCIRAGITDKVQLIPSTNQPSEYFKLADLFILTSREESFSLVTLEAINRKLPVLCFEQVGGTEEILQYNKIFIVPYANVSAMAIRIISIYKNPNETAELTKNMSENMNPEFDFIKMAEKIKKEIERYI